MRGASEGFRLDANVTWYENFAQWLLKLAMKDVFSFCYERI